MARAYSLAFYLISGTGEVSRENAILDKVTALRGQILSYLKHRQRLRKIGRFIRKSGAVHHFYA